jgi:hypothetical protein
MPVFDVEFTQRAQFTLVAKSREEAEQTIKGLGDQDLRDFMEEWEHSLRDIAMGEEHADCGVWEGQVLALDDYQREVKKYALEHPDEAERERLAEQAKYTLPLPFPLPFSKKL